MSETGSQQGASGPIQLPPIHVTDYELPEGVPALDVERHVANEVEEWVAVCTFPDFCQVGNQVVPFDSSATMDTQFTSSPNVKAQQKPTYRANDLFKNVQGDAGEHVVSKTALQKGYVKILEGHCNVKVNGIPVARHDSACMINTNEFGVGGTLGRLFTSSRIPALSDDLKADLEYFNAQQNRANESADEIDRQIAEQKAQLSKTSWWNPKDWGTRGEINATIEKLEQSQQSLSREALYYREQAQLAAETLWPNQPTMSASPTSNERRELQRQAAEKRRGVNRIGMAAGGIVTVPAVLADAAGAPNESVEILAEIGANVIMPGRGPGNIPVVLGSRGGRGPGGRRPLNQRRSEGSGVYVKVREGKGAKELTVDPLMLDELRKAGVKFSPDNVIATTRTPDGKIVFLETGNSRAGLQHVVERHAGDFANIGVAESQIPKTLMRAVTEGKIVGYQGKDTGRAIYETVVNGQRQRIAISVSDNGFIVGANPAGGVK